MGALDMAGSEFEWTRSLYKPYPYDPEDGREDGFGVGPDSKMVFRGSALYHEMGLIMFLPRPGSSHNRYCLLVSRGALRSAS